DRGIPLVGLGHVEVHIARGVADFVGERLAFVVEDVADHHLGALLDEHPRVFGAHPAGTPTDECNFAVYPSHAGLLSVRWSPKCWVCTAVCRLPTADREWSGYRAAPRSPPGWR